VNTRYRGYSRHVHSPLKNIRFIGKVDNVVPLIAICDILIFAGCTPHFPRPVYEAWALKKPIVAFDMDGISDNIENDIDGVIVNENTCYGLSNAIPSVNSRMGKNGYKKAMERFDMNKNIEKIIKIYGEI